MALSNGDADMHDRSKSPAQYLGKRKRTPSLQSDAGRNAKPTSIQQDLKDALQLLRRHDPTATLLKHPLPPRAEDGHANKKQRTGSPDFEVDNIESRISRSVYNSLNDLIVDVNHVKRSLSKENAKEPASTGSDTITKDQIGPILRSLTDLQYKPDESRPSTASTTNALTNIQNIPRLPPNQVLSLRSQTESGIRQLFSGLQHSTGSNDVDGTKLPNGFELTEVLTVDKNDLQGKEPRKFGEVFAPHRNTKNLEMPRTSRTVRGNVVNFIPPYENISSSTRNDFKQSNLATGFWLDYGFVDKSKAETGDKTINAASKTDALFNGVFSSFAPSVDNHRSMITEYNRSQQWWRKYAKTTPKEGTLITQAYSEIAPQVENLANVSDQEFEDMIAGYIHEDDGISESNKVLDEISELIQTMSSYQANRNLEVARGPSSASKPSNDEQDTYELLRTQLQLLVSTLPPFAVAKLNGDQLDELNISTHIIISPPEFVGIGQVDEYTMRKNRATQAATSSAGRNAIPAPSRPAYGTPASAYNAQARAYNNIPSTAYAARPPNAPVYNTPRPAATPHTVPYTQPQYRPNNQMTPSIQQFQRPTVNGYGSATAPTPQSAYLQRPTQPGFQQRPHDASGYNASPKPMVNGDASHYQQRTYSGLSNKPGSAPTIPGQQPPTAETLKQRQASGKPQPLVHAETSVTATS